ncbi:MAG: hypothetical protein U0R80_03300 [Nocardioidaceae bacterium]
MSDLKERFDELLVGVPAHVVPEGLARSAVAEGVRRRRTGRVLAAGAAAAVLAVLAAVAGLLPHGNPLGIAGTTRHADGYPTRIDVPWVPRTMSDRSGPIAGLVERAGGSVSDDRSRWWAVSEDGSLRRVPVRDFMREPVLSPTGTKLAVFSGPKGASERGRMQLWDLVTGQRVTLEQIGSNASDLPDRPEYWLQEQVPGFWSPDERRVLLNAQRWEGAPIAGVLASWDGSVEPILLEGHNSAWPVGWLDDERIGWLSEDDDGRRDTARFLVSDTSGALLSTDGLDVSPDPMARGTLDQWSGWLSPDGARLALRYERSSHSDPFIAVFDVATGRKLDRWWASTTDVFGSLMWQGDRVLSPAGADSGVGIVQDTNGTEPVIRADPRTGIGYSYWAADALAGEPHRGAIDRLTGNAGWAPLWWWREVLLGTTVLAGLWWLARRRRLRRTR